MTTLLRWLAIFAVTVGWFYLVVPRTPPTWNRR